MSVEPANSERLSEHEITLRGERVVLQPLTEQDFGVLLRWNNDPEVLFFAEGDWVTARTLEEVQRLYRGVSRAAFCFMIEVDRMPVGECCLQRMNLARILDRYPNLDCRRVDITIGDKRLWGRGLGTEAVRLLLQFAFECQSAEAIFGCDIGDWNPRSRRLFDSLGFTVDRAYPQTPGSKGGFADLVLTRERYTFLRASAI